MHLKFNVHDVFQNSYDPLSIKFDVVELYLAKIYSGSHN